MHDLRLIHTDLKPENILLVSSEYVKVLDYKVNGFLWVCGHIYVTCHMVFGLVTFIWCALMIFSGVANEQVILISICRLHLDHQRIVPTIKKFQNQVLSRLLILVAQHMSVKTRTILCQQDIIVHLRSFLVCFLHVGLHLVFNTLVISHGIKKLGCMIWFICRTWMELPMWYMERWLYIGGIVLGIWE